MSQTNNDQAGIQQAIDFLRLRDKTLARLIDRIGPLNHNRKRRRSGFQAIVSIIVGQQLSGKAAESIFERVRALTGQRTITPDGLRHLTDRKLRRAGLSEAKVRSIRDLLCHIDEGRLKVRTLPRLSDQEVHEALTQVKGLGPWSAQMYLMFVLQRHDVFSPGDLGIRKAVAQLYGVDPDKTDLEELSQRWRPYRTIACWYLWQSLAAAKNGG